MSGIKPSSTNGTSPSMNISPYELQESSSAAASLRVTLRDENEHRIPSNKMFKRQHSLSLWTRKWFTNWWGGELISWLFAAISIAAIVITLIIHNGRPLPEWPLGVTPNVLLSIFAAVGETALLQPVTECISQLKWLWFTKKHPLEEFQVFDEASRGRMGSLKILWKLRGLHLVSLGAGITIVTIAFGPFVQKILDYPSELREGGYVDAPVVFNSGYLSYPINPSMLAAVYDGLSNSGATLSSIPTNCNTGHCIWPVYPSLGICAKVVDVSEYLTQHSCNVPRPPSRFGSTPQYLFIPCFNYTLRRGRGTPSIPFSYALNSSTVIKLANEPQDPFRRGATLLDIYIFHQPWSTSSVSTTPVVLEVKLEFCVHIYETTVHLSQTTTTMISSEQFNSSEGGRSIRKTTHGVDFVLNALHYNIFSWSISKIFVGSCMALIPGSGIVGEAKPALGCHTTAFNALGITADQETGLASDIKLAVESVMNNTAITMTNATRQGVGGINTIRPTNGTSYVSDTYIHVNYIWLTLPISLVLLTLIFLLAIIFQSHRAKTEIWKSASQPVLQGLDHTLHGQLGGLHMMDEIESISNGLEVEMVIGKDKVWSLVRS